MSANKIDLTDKRFGRLVVIGEAGRRGRKVVWHCRCDCGNEKDIVGSRLRLGETKSCGCIHREAAAENCKTIFSKHGMSETRLYHVWEGMKSRCYNEKAENFPDYGGRGITICDEWINSFEVFQKWSISNGYTDELTIDRIDVNGNYEPKNCQWKTIAEQQSNKRNNHFETYNGETLTLAQWARKIPIQKNILRQKIKSGWTLEQIIREHTDIVIRTKT